MITALDKRGIRCSTDVVGPVNADVFEACLDQFNEVCTVELSGGEPVASDNEQGTGDFHSFRRLLLQVLNDLVPGKFDFSHDGPLFKLNVPAIPRRPRDLRGMKQKWRIIKVGRSNARVSGPRWHKDAGKVNLSIDLFSTPQAHRQRAVGAFDIVGDEEVASPEVQDRRPFLSRHALIPCDDAADERFKQVH